MSDQIFLKNGTVLQHDEKDNVVDLRNTDILIADGRIVEIGKGINKSKDASVINCEGKIISPGFINAHHHMWQSQLKGLLGDCTMLDYMLEGTCIQSRVRKTKA
jgi:cytosine/adenosine deaminase-related metal-dependent hydrolase